MTKNYDIFGLPTSQTQNTDAYDERTQVRKKTIMALLIVLLIIQLGASSLAGFLAWYRYELDLRNIRLLKTFGAAVFAIPYLMYFFIIRILLRVTYV